MHTEETREREDKAKSADRGFASTGQRMFDMMSACCRGQDVSPDCCSAAMKGMMETMRSQPCCAPGTKDVKPGEEQK